MDAKSKREVAKKAVLYDSTKDRIKARIKSNIKTAIEKLEQTVKELLNDVEIEFGQNPFSEFLANENPTPAEVKSILSQVIPSNFGPDEESFHPLFREIEALKAWQGDVTSCFDLTPKNVSVENVSVDSITLMWEDDWRAAFYQIEVDGSKILERTTTNTFTKRGLLPGSEHKFRVRSVRGSSVSKWSDAVRGWTKWECIWKECPDNVDIKRKYTVDEENPRIVTKNESGVEDGDDDDESDESDESGSNEEKREGEEDNEVEDDEDDEDEEYFDCTIIGNTPLPLNRVTSWSIKILKSWENDGTNIFIGVAPSGIDQNEDDNYEKCGWYFDCFHSTLDSGPPHNYPGKEYGPRKGDGRYVHNGDVVGVVMDTTKGELSFVVNGVNLGVAYGGIPLDKPLVPCVLLCCEGDSVELDTSEVKETIVDSSIPVPSSISAKNGITWDSITLTWDPVEGASFYQIEVDGSKFWCASTTNTFTKIGLLPDTEHTFRVRTVRGNTVSEWSDVVKGRTMKNFANCAWKKCPDDVDEKRKYSVDEKNPRIATNTSGCLCTIIGNTSLLLNKVTSWNIKVLKSRDNDGSGINIGVAPFDINQNIGYNYNKCGWYFYCYSSRLRSGPPHNYSGKEYGPRKENGQYVRTRDIVGVVMDTTKGELSFVLNGVNLGVAYEGILLDKPLVPCVLLRKQGDSVEFVI